MRESRRSLTCPSETRLSFRLGLAKPRICLASRRRTWRRSALPGKSRPSDARHATPIESESTKAQTIHTKPSSATSGIWVSMCSAMNPRSVSKYSSTPTAQAKIAAAIYITMYDIARGLLMRQAVLTAVMRCSAFGRPKSEAIISP